MDDPPLGFHSLHEETTATVAVEGRLPDWLSGVLIRNGPGAFSFGDATVDHWFDGLATLYRFGLDGERDRVTYRNRFLRTDAYERAQAGTFDGGFATGSAGLLRRLYRLVFGDSYDNTNVVAERLDDRYLALTESPRRVAFDPDTLATLGHDQYDGPAPAGQLACAHLRHDPEHGTAVNFETAFGRTNHYHVHEIGGGREHVASIPVEEPAYMHSFGLTPGYVVLTEFPFVVDPMDFLRPGSRGPFVEHFRWEPERGTRFLVVDRASGEVVAEPRAGAFFGFHHANAYRDGDDLVVDLETVPDASSVATLSLERLRAGDIDVLGGRLERFRIDPEAGTVDRHPVYADGTALPTVPRTRWCREHRYVYAQGTDQPVTEWPTAVLKIDADAGRAREFRGDCDHYGEPLMVPRPDADREDAGVVLTVGLDRDAERSVLVVLDARSFERVARAPLPHAAPFDFHGRWFPELDP